MSPSRIRAGLLTCAAMTLAACGPAGPTSAVEPAVVLRAAEDHAGPDKKIYAGQVSIRAAGGDMREHKMLVSCTPASDCRIVGPDALLYTDLDDFTQRSRLVKEGESVFASSWLHHPRDLPAATDSGAQATMVKITKDPPSRWGWYAGGAALLAALITAWLALRRRAAGKRAQTSVNVPADESSDASTPNGNDH